MNNKIKRDAVSSALLGIIMSRPRTYPDEIYLSHENEGTEDLYYHATKTPNDLAELGVKKRVGRYLLAEVVKVEGKVVVHGDSMNQCHPELQRKYA
jgi:hypothetical protein